MWANWSSCHLIGHRWGRWQISDCYSWTATLCVSSGRLDPAFWATNKVVISSWSLFLRLERWPFAHKYSIFPDMLDIPLASVKRLVHMVEILWEYSEFISLRKWSSFVLPALIIMNLGTCMRKWSKTLRISTRWCVEFSINLFSFPYVLRLLSSILTSWLVLLMPHDMDDPRTSFDGQCLSSSKLRDTDMFVFGMNICV